ITELTDLGWKPVKTENGYILTFDQGVPPRTSLAALRRVHGPMVVKLQAIDDSISSWTSLPNLSLDLSLARVVSNLEPLRNLTNLYSLNLTITQVSNLDPLRSLTNLSSLNLMNTRVSNLEPLRGLTNLSTLNLSFTQVSNLEPLRNLTN